MARFPLLPFTIPFILGIALCYAIGWAGWFVIVVFACAGVTAYLLKRRLISIFLFGLATGYLMAVLRSPVSLPREAEGEHQFSGVIMEEKEQSAMKVMVVRIDSCDCCQIGPFLAKALLPSLGTDAAECSRMNFVGKMNPLSHVTDLPDEIDYNSHLAIRGVSGECYILPDSIRSIIPERGLLNDIRRFRLEIASILARGDLSTDATDFLIATLTGERSLLTYSQRELFSRSGLAHLLAVSGLHVGIITMALGILLFPLTLLGFHRAVGFIVVIVMWGFAILTGLTPSVTRSVIMCTVFLLTALLQREWTPVNALCIAALIILSFSPASLFSIGFQLSFTAVLSIIVFADRLNPVSRGTPGRWAVMLLTVPTAALLGTGIISIYNFHTFPVLFLLSNVVASLSLPVLLGAGVLKVFFAFMGFTTGWIDCVIESAYGLIDRVMQLTEQLSFSQVDGINITLPVVVAWTVALLFFGVWLYRKRIVWLAASVLTLILCVSLPWLTNRVYHKDELYITRSHSETNIFIKEGDRLFVYTTASPPEAAERLAVYSARYADYMLKRGLKALEHLPDEYRGKTLIRQGNIITFRDCRLHIVTKQIDCMADSVDYAVVCRGFRGDILRLSHITGADTVLLSSDLDLRRHDRYARELSLAGIPYKSLREAPLILR